MSSSFVVPIVRVGKIGKHPKADTLSITEAEGCPCIFKTGDFQTGDLAVYIPVDAVVHENLPWVRVHLPFLKFKNGTHRVKAIRLREIFSMGILVALEKVVPDLLSPGPAGGGEVVQETFREGSDLQHVLGVTKYEEPEDASLVGLGGERDRDPGYMPVYEISNYRKFRHVFLEGTGDVVVTEKLHGCNARFIHDGARLWVGSHRTWKTVESSDIWNKLATELGLHEKLRAYPMVGVYGEVYGDVQDLTYGEKKGSGALNFRVFDAYLARPTGLYITDTGEIRECAQPSRYMDYEEMLFFCESVGLTTVPVLHVGPFIQADVEALANGNTKLWPGEQIREGVVIKSRFEDRHPEIGRKILKLVSEAYLLRKDGTERH